VDRGRDENAGALASKAFKAALKATLGRPGSPHSRTDIEDPQPWDGRGIGEKMLTDSGGVER
jgi:hypothetical protein